MVVGVGRILLYFRTSMFSLFYVLHCAYILCEIICETIYIYICACQMRFEAMRFKAKICTFEAYVSLFLKKICVSFIHKYTSSRDIHLPEIYFFQRYGSSRDLHHPEVHLVQIYAPPTSIDHSGVVPNILTSS